MPVECRSLLIVVAASAACGFAWSGCTPGAPQGDADDAGRAGEGEGEGEGEGDAGPDDAGPVDGGEGDDAGPLDAGVVDAGFPDAGFPDAGFPDAGPPPLCADPLLHNGGDGVCIPVGTCSPGFWLYDEDGRCHAWKERNTLFWSDIFCDAASTNHTDGAQDSMFIASAFRAMQQARRSAFSSTGEITGSWINGLTPTERLYCGGVHATTDALYWVGGMWNLAPDEASAETYISVLTVPQRHSTGEWEPTTPMTVARYGPTAVVIDGRLLVLGGTDMVNRLSSIESADVLADGTLGPFGLVGAMPEDVLFPLVTEIDDSIVIVGGYSDSDVNTLYSTPRTGPDSLNVWTARSTTDVPISRCARWQDSVFCISASVLNGTGGIVEEYDLQALDVPPTRLAPFFKPRADHGVVATGEYLYLIGGYQDLGPTPGFDLSTYSVWLPALRAAVEAP